MINRLITVIFLALVFCSKLEARTPIDDIRQIASDGLVQVENLAGSIKVTAWDKSEVHISGELGNDVEELEVQESSSGLKIRVHNRKGQHNVDETHLQLSVPSSISLEVESVSADLSVHGLQSESVSFHSVSGEIKANIQVQRFDSETVSGDLEFSGTTPRANVSSVSGDVGMAGLGEEISINTVSGDVVVTQSRVSRGRIQTVSGDLTIRLEVADRGRLKLESMSGDVLLELPAGQQAEFTAQTYSGDMRSDFGEVSGKTRGAGRSLFATVGDNGNTIQVESFSGNIQIRSD